jgi:hypothetical protein
VSGPEPRRGTALLLRDRQFTESTRALAEDALESHHGDFLGLIGELILSLQEQGHCRD